MGNYNDIRPPRERGKRGERGDREDRRGGRRGERSERGERGARGERFGGRGGNNKDNCRLFVALGKKDGMTKKKLVDFINDETSVPSRMIDDVQVIDAFSFLS